MKLFSVVKILIQKSWTDQYLRQNYGTEKKIERNEKTDQYYSLTDYFKEFWVKSFKR